MSVEDVPEKGPRPNRIPPKKKVEAFSVPAFRRWLTMHGAEVLKVTETWELVKFRSNGTTGTICRSKNNGLSFSGEAEIAYNAYRDGKAWTGTKRTSRRRNRGSTITTLLHRDGPTCFFCLNDLGEDITVEHLVSLAAGGPNHISNLVLAHTHCNSSAGSLSAMEKVVMRERNRLKLTAASSQPIGKILRDLDIGRKALMILDDCMNDMETALRIGKEDT